MTTGMSGERSCMDHDGAIFEGGELAGRDLDATVFHRCDFRGSDLSVAFAEQRGAVVDMTA